MECNQKTIARLKRAQGQMNGILKMIDGDRSCEEIMIQLSALRAGIDKIMALIATENLIQTIEESQPLEKNENIERAVEILVRSR